MGPLLTSLVHICLLTGMRDIPTVGMWLLEGSVDEPGCVRLGLVLLGSRRPVEGPMMQRVVLLLRLRVWGAMRGRLVLLPACTI